MSEPGRLAESPDRTLLTEPSTTPIVDASGNAWRITAGWQVSVNGMILHSMLVNQLAYVGRLIWCQARDLTWWSKVKPSDPWADPTPTSPLAGPKPSRADILASIAALKLDLNSINAAMILLVTNFAEVAAASAQQSATGQFQIMQALMELDGRLADIVAAIAALAKPETRKIVLDFAHATDVPQPVPPRQGS